jgi:hypothetical protein
VSTRPITVVQFIDMLMNGIQAGDWAGDDVLLISSDPEGNRYVAFDAEPGVGYAPLKLEPTRLGYRAVESSTPDAVLIMPTHEIDPEF